MIDATYDINDSRVVDGILAGVGLAGDAIPAAKALMKERNIVGLRAFGKPQLIDFALRRGGRDGIAAARNVCATAESQAALDRLESLLMRAAALGYGERVSIDFALLRDLDYYTGFIFEGYLPEIGFPLCGGGRYDSLLPKFGYAVPAVGWSAGVERLLIALERRGKHITRRRHRVDVLVSGADVVAKRERAAGNIVRYASSGQNEAALIAEARAHGIARIVIAENGDIREVHVSPAPEKRLPKTATPRRSEAS
jgi:ATP phosphoribosyltransferase regulatory subunit